MVKLEISLRDEDFDRLLEIMEQENRSDLPAQDYAKELLTQTIRQRHPSPASAN